MNHQESGNRQAIPREPAFPFCDLPPSERLTYQLLTTDNYHRLHQLFRNDLNGFVDERFKVMSELEHYVNYQMEFARYSTRRGGCDWLFIRDNHYAGVLHLYDLSREQTADRHRRCTIGFATAGAFRRHGLTREAVLHLVGYLFSSFDMKQILSYTRKDNLAAIGLLEGLGFTGYEPDHWWEDLQPGYRYFHLLREQSGKI